METTETPLNPPWMLSNIFKDCTSAMHFSSRVKGTNAQSRSVVIQPDLHEQFDISYH